jgi:CubicO group peptidase (beta-lactamase class C family)
LNQGHLVGELVRRVTGKSLTKFIAEEIAGPLGADFQIGALEKDWPRISTLLPPPPLTEQAGANPADKDSIAMKALSDPTPSAEFALGPEWRRGEIGAANGHGNARSLVRVLSTVSLGGEGYGVKILSPSTIDTIFREQTNGMDLVLNKPIRFGIGFGLPLPETVPWIPEGRKCFWCGWVSGRFQSEIQICARRTLMMHRAARRSSAILIRR